MALANIAVLLAMWGKRVLVVDWDLEAPGIEHFLTKGNDLDSLTKRKGVIDLLTEASETPTRTLSEDDAMRFVFQRQIKGNRTPISILTAGARNQGYFQNVRKLDVKKFYEDHEGGHMIESLRNHWKSRFDFVLIDSRTGITDIGGICTIQLPDILALDFTATEQSLVGAVDVARKAATERQKLPFDRALVPCLPIPSRFDTQTEHQIAKVWLRRFEEALEPLYRQWLPIDVDRRAFLELSKIPYTPYFSFGEGLPVIEQGTTDPTGLGYAYETVAALVGTNLQHAALLISSRDELVQLARTETPISKADFKETPLNFVLLVSAVVSRPNLSPPPSRHAIADFKRSLEPIVKSVLKSTKGELLISNGETWLLAFSSPATAIECALKIAESLVVKKPISGPLGQLQARMAIHGPSRTQVTESMRGALFPSAVEMVSKAREGEILISAPAVKATGSELRNVEFVSIGKQLELEVEDEEHILGELYEVVGFLEITLTDREREFLLAQDPKSRAGGGFQAFLVGLQKKVDKATGTTRLTLADRERIARYAHDYKGGGWQGRLRKIFGRTLGANLGRDCS